MEGRGGKFAGPSIRRIIQEPLLGDLGNKLPDSISSLVVDYLASLWALYGVCMAEVLVENWEDFINRFAELFWRLYHHEDLSGNQRKVNETYKVHNLIDHLPDTFR